MTSRIRGRTAIVTGAATGLGHAYAHALARAGADVAVCDERESIHELPGELASYGVRARSWQADVADAASVHHVVQETGAEFGRIDILINNAGVWGDSRPDDDLDKTERDYERIVGTNLKGAFLFGRAVIGVLLAQGTGGEIVNIATDHMVTCGTPHDVCPRLPSCPWKNAPRPTGGGDRMDLYDAAKWGLNGLTLAWAQALRAHRIRVNAFCMGATDTEMLRGFHNHAPSPEEEASWMRPEDSARALIELLEEGPEGRTGRNMNFCIGRPCRLEPPLPPLYILEEALNGSA